MTELSVSPMVDLTSFSFVAGGTLIPFEVSFHFEFYTNVQSLLL